MGGVACEGSAPPAYLPQHLCSTLPVLFVKLYRLTILSVTVEHSTVQFSTVQVRDHYFNVIQANKEHSILILIAPENA